MDYAALTYNDCSAFYLFIIIVIIVITTCSLTLFSVLFFLNLLLQIIKLVYCILLGTAGRRYVNVKPE